MTTSFGESLTISETASAARSERSNGRRSAQGKGDEGRHSAEDLERNDPAGGRPSHGELDAAAEVFRQPDRAILERVRHVA